MTQDSVAADRPDSARDSAPSSMLAWLSLLICGSAIVWLRVPDRLDLSKLAFAHLGLAVVLIWMIASNRVRLGVEALAIAGYAAVVLLLLPEFAQARVEGLSHALVVVVVFAISRAHRPAALAYWLRPTVALLAVLSIAQALGADLLVLPEFGGRRTLSTFGNPDFMAYWMVGVTPWVLPDLNRDDETGRARWFGAIGAALALIAVLLSGCRGAWLALPLMCLPMLRFEVRRWLTAGLLVAASVALVMQLTGSVDLFQRLRVDELIHRSFNGRLHLWKTNASMMREAGLLGGGPAAFQRLWPEAQGRALAERHDDVRYFSDIRHAHFDVAEVAIDWGWPSVALLLLVVWLIWRNRGDPERRRARYALLGLAICGLSGPTLYQPATAVLMAVSAGMAAGGGRVLTRRWVLALPLLAMIGVGILLAGRYASERQRTLGMMVESNLATAAQTQGETSLVRDRFNDAESHYRAATGLDHTNPLPHMLLGRLMLLDGRNSQAASELRLAADELPIPLVFEWWAMAEAALGNVERAAALQRQMQFLRGE